MSASQELNRGFVTFYNQEKGYGFIRDEQDKSNVFFHVSQYGRYEFTGADNPRFSPRTDPSSGIRVVYERAVGPKGPIARQVATVNSYRSAKEQIDKRLTYRLVQRTGEHERGRLYTGLEYKYHIIWSGKDLEELRRLHGNRTWITIGKRQGMCHYFEYLNAEGEWEECGDPR